MIKKSPEISFDGRSELVVAPIVEDPNCRKIGNYSFNVRFCLGEGSYGKVFHGRDIKNNSEVAIKQIETKFIEQHDKYIKQQIISEIDILKKFNHPNIVQFIDLIESNNYIYIITEFCKDGDLKEFLNHKRITELEAFTILKDIVQGFKELNKNNIIHRDLKPANILINDGIYKIADFGFAKAVSNITSTYMFRSLVGSPYYMAPQLLANQQYCYKCDIWSLAVIYYEMLNGDLPWLASDPSSLLKKILQQPIINKLKSSKNSSFSLYFLERCLTIDETKRPSWEELYQMIIQCPLYKQLRQQSQSSQVSMFNNVPDDEPLTQQINIRQNILEVDGNLQTKSQLEPPPEQTIILINQLIYQLQSQRQELTFKHYIACEILMNKQELILIYNSNNNIDNENNLIKFLIVLTKIITNQSQNRLNILKDYEKKYPEYFQISKNLTTIRQLIWQEDEFYITYQRDLKVIIEKEYSDWFKLDDDLKQFMDLDSLQLKDNTQKIYHDSILLKYGLIALQEFYKNFDDISNQIKLDDDKFQLLKLIEQIIGLMKVLNNQFEEDQIHYEELYTSISTETEIDVYLSIMKTNLNALLLN